jgi:hypothetical protein
VQPVQKPTAPPPTQSSDLFAPVHDFFASGVWTYVRNGAIFLAAVLWLGSVVWTLKDARRRIADPVLVLVAGIVGAVPVLGTLVYLLVRPPEYLDDVAERRLEIDALEAELAAARLRCGSCEARIQPDFLVCPLCSARLKERCARCGAALEPLWRACPACATLRTGSPATPPHAKPGRRRGRRQRVALDGYLLDVARELPEDAATAQAAPAPETV